MYLIQEENKDLREDLERLKILTYEDRMKEMHKDNFQVRKRNGQLMIQLADAQRKVGELQTTSRGRSSLPPRDPPRVQGPSCARRMTWPW
jgi:hypothetical protein